MTRGGGAVCQHRKVLSSAALVQSYDSLLLDLDGVVYIGADPVPQAVATISTVQQSGRRVCYVTNNAARPPGEVADHLIALGLQASASDVVTSAQAGAQLVAAQTPRGSAVLAVGGPGVAAALTEAGFVVVDAISDPLPDTGDDVAAVMQGFGTEVGWRALARASFAIARGIPWIATNTDLTIPVSGGVAPGNGTLVHAVAMATGRTPEVAGKPFPPMSQGLRPLVVGDRLDTDIEGACNAKMSSLLVLTGVSRALDLWRAPATARPQHLARDLSDLLRPALKVHLADGRTTSGPASARITGSHLDLDVAEDPVGAIWAAAHAIWAADAEPDNAVELAASLDEML